MMTSLSETLFSSMYYLILVILDISFILNVAWYYVVKLFLKL